MFEDTWLIRAALMIPVLPLGGFVVLALFGEGIKRDKEERGAALLACATVLLSFALSAFAVIRLHGLVGGTTGLHFAQPYLGFDWIDVAGFSIPLSLLLDPLSSVMVLVVTGVGSLIHIYSLGYMAHDEDRVRYFSYLNLFTFFMLLLVLAGSLPLMFVGWEGVGLCSYLLIGFWFRRKSATDAGMKAFVVNRIGDVGLILGMILAYHAFGSLDLVVIADNAGALAPEGLGEFGSVTLVCLFLFLGACGKSAQIPLHVWLPDAMEGPTPVSALIHAATMVTAGVYMVARLAPLFHLSATAMAVVAATGAATALLGATIALVQTDIKRVLAYSTVSQLGYMFLACGVGVFGVAIFHLFTHAFFKALLFLGAGSVIHALSGEQDMRNMGGLRTRIPWTFWTFLVGSLALAGIPPLAGFFSKDEILLGAFSAGRTDLFAVGLLTALLTAFYMGRLVFLTFFGSYRGGQAAEHHLHESPWSMLGPLVLLALGSAAAGFLAVPELLEPVFRQPPPPGRHVPWLPLLATLNAVIAIAAAFYAYLVYTALPARVSAVLAPLRRLFEAKYFFDDAYNGLAAWLVRGSEVLLWKRIDAGVIDAAVNGAARTVEALGQRARLAQTGFVRLYALLILAGAVALFGYLLWS
jgi:NADH-quinone oxidoreductase subunit L